MRQLLLFIICCFIAKAAYSFIPISITPIYAPRTDLNNTVKPYKYEVNKIVLLEQKKPQKRHEKSMKEREKLNIVGTKIPSLKN